VITCMVQKIYPGTFLNAILSAMLWVCVGFTIWSGIGYTLSGLRVLRSD
jgi:hypothetical protein